jgi:methyl-accepting chemotaxis protein
MTSQVRAAVDGRGLATIKQLGVGTKLAVIGGLAAVCLLVTGVVVLDRLTDAQYDGRKLGTQNVVESAVSTLTYFESLERSGEMTRDQAQAAARSAIGTLRYGDGEYFWIHNTDLVMEMHPIKPELDGTRLDQTADPNGVLLFVEATEVVAADGAGFVKYEWPKPGFDDPQPKISYVAGFQPWGWIVGSGVYVDDIDAAVAGDRLTFLVGFVVLVGLAGLGAWVVRSLFARLSDFGEVATQIAGGDLSVDPLGVDEGGSVGQLANAFDEMTGTLRAVGHHTEQIAAGRISTDHRIPGELGRTFDSMSASLTSMVQRLDSSARSLSTTATDLASASDRVSQSAQRTAQEAKASSDKGDQVSSSVAMVASAIEEMNSSINDVSLSAGEAAHVAGEAVEVARQTSSTIGKLGDSSEEIGNVVQVIKSIAEQTNLLALNATIEAARAGESGKGFAVVANEVKELADQTAKATEEIAERIEVIQTDTASAVTANSRIGETIDRISEISKRISAAVDQQSMVTAEIGRNMDETATGSADIAQSITDVSSAAAETTRSIQEAQEASDGIQHIASELDQVIAFYR